MKKRFDYLQFKRISLQDIRTLYKVSKKKKEEKELDDENYIKIKKLFNLAVATEVQEKVNGIDSEEIYLFPFHH
jgi:hypothetical protein